jgi:serine/threonine protein kinase/Tol biopolymer transport system component
MQMPQSAGKKLGPYEIVALIGSGAMGKVYRARDLRLGREVAIKVLHANVADDPHRLARFEREARALAALNHPHIVTIFSVEEADGTSFLTMELVEGRPLDRLIPAGGFPAEEFVEFAVELADALAAAHEKGIVHRDLKPANIMVTKDGRIKVLDFGLVRDLRGFGDEDATRASAGETQAGMVVGTPAYMSPEQIAGGPVDHRTDIFSLGVALHQMASGRHPFSGGSSPEKMSSILRDTPEPLTVLRPDLPAELARIVRRCLEKDPRRRMQSARDVANELRDLTRPAVSQVSYPAMDAVTAGYAQTQIEPRSASGSFPPKTRRERVRAQVNRALAATIIIAVIVVPTLWYLQRPLPSLRVLDYIQITHDGRTKLLAGTDGSRLYFTLSSPNSIAEVAVTGGEIAHIPVELAGADISLLDVSPDGSSFLVNSGGRTATGTIWNVRILGGSVRRIEDAAALDAAYSPDGKTIAYSTRDGDIWLAQSDGGNAHKLPPVGGHAYLLAWSPDGQAIRFTKDDRIWEIAANGTDLHPLLPDWRHAGAQLCGRWTPDGNFFLFVNGGEIWALDERRGLLRKPSGEPIQLTTGPIHWAPPIPGKDGKNIFAVGYHFRGELSRLDSRTKQLQPFLGGISADGVSFSKDGNSVAYTSNPDGALWKARQDGTSAIQLTDAPFIAFMPRWSPDGGRILFVDASQLPATIKAYTVSSDGGSPKLLLPEDDGYQTDPNWSPDGRKIVFCKGWNQNQKSVLRILDLASRQVTTIPGSDGMFSPRWSPDGRSIVAMSPDSKALSIFDIGTQKWSNVSRGGLLSYPMWSKDSQFIYFLNTARGDQGVYRVRTVGGNSERVVDLNDRHLAGLLSGYWLGLDPADSPLLLLDTGSDDIYSISIEGD